MKTELEEATERYFKELSPDISFKKAVEFGAKWQAERMYSEEEVIGILDKFLTSMVKDEKTGIIEEWFEQFKKK